MKNHFHPYELLAELFRYPTEDFPETVGRVQSVLDEQFPAVAELLHPFTRFIGQATLSQMEELFMRTFEVQSVTTLDIGYVLFGDDYKRGKLLVHLNQEHRKAENDCYHELADHLPNILRLLPKMDDTALRQELVEKIVVPALNKIIGEFDPQKVAEKNKVYQKHHKALLEEPPGYGTIYVYPLKAVLLALQQDFQVEKAAPMPPGSVDFLKAVGTEMTIETSES
jgi:nitrate reductase molybdenum cofactor assembly chaperone